MAIKPLPSPDVLRQLLTLDPGTGKLFWKERNADMFTETAKRTAAHAAANWNSRYAGTEAFTHTNDSGYRTGRVFDVLMRAHRVIFAMTKGRWPDGEVDHINGDRSDNRPANLREVDRTENSHNAAMHRDNSSGHIGVSWYPKISKWCARIHVDGTQYHLGVFPCIGQAIRARREAERRHGFHPNHGRAA